MIDGRALRFTHLDRVLYPATGFTKADLIRYYLAVADVLLTHLRGRPLTLGRFPGGVDARGFAQTEVPGLPDWVRTAPLALADGTVKRFTLVDERAALAWLAQMGTVEIHTFLGALPELERPTMVLFDLDPASADGILDTALVACRLRSRLTDMGLVPLAKTSGGTGMHVVAPLPGDVSYAETRGLAQRIASEIAAVLPELVTMRMARAERRGRVLIDVRQNSARLTTVAPYSLRANTRPTASVPLTWSEVEAAVATGNAGMLVFEAADVIARLAIPTPGVASGFASTPPCRDRRL
jgi:bifunctional non-homologous end joining protein LigD